MNVQATMEEVHAIISVLICTEDIIAAAVLDSQLVGTHVWVRN
jgi:hypothetical protein